MENNQERASLSSTELKKQLLELERESRNKKRQENGFWGFGEESFFNFSNFWSSSLIKFAYFIGVILINGILVLSAVGLFIDFSLGIDLSFSEQYLSGMYREIGQLLLLFLGGIVANLLWRLLCEVCMIPFRLYEVLKGMDQRLADLERKLK